MFDLLFKENGANQSITHTSPCAFKRKEIQEIQLRLSISCGLQHSENCRIFIEYNKLCKTMFGAFDYEELL